MPTFSYGQVKKPDFAFPATVAKEADTDLKVAIKAKDAHAAINALIRESVAQAMIDPAEAQANIERVDSIAMLFADSPLQGMFQALLAQLYSAMYDGNQWVYNMRELPLTPLPQNITEWSGDQFKAKIKELCAASYANPDALNALPLSEYTDLVEANKLTLLYFPTLLDFIYANASSLLQNMGEGKFFPTIPLAYPFLSEPSRIYWLTQKALSSDEPEQALKEAYLNVSDSQFNAYILGEMASRVHFYNDKAIENALWISQEISHFQDKYPNNPLADWLKNLEQIIKCPELSISTPKYCTPGVPIKITVTNRSANQAKVNVYYMGPSLQDNSRISKLDFSKLIPIKSYDIESQDQVPFVQDSTLEFTPDQGGSYLFMPAMANSELNRSYSDYTYCVPAMPIAFSNCEQPWVAVVEPSSGKPISGVEVSLYTNKDSVVVGKTNKDGLIDISRYLNAKQWNYSEIALNFAEEIYRFNVSAITWNQRKPKDIFNASINTDRAIYHPGDSIHVLSVVYAVTWNDRGISSNNICEGKAVKATLRDANDQEIKTIEGITDQYGRFAVDFEAPATGLTGDFYIFITGDKLNSSTSITVSDYRMPDFEIIDLTSTRMADDLDMVQVKGRALSYSGFPMSDAKIDISIVKANWWRWFVPETEVLYSITATTDSNGYFQIEVPVAEIQNKISRWSYFMAKIDATSSAGASAKAFAPLSLGKQYKIEIGDLPQYVDGLKPFKPEISAVGIDGKDVNLGMKWNLAIDNDIKMQGIVGNPIDISGLAPGNYVLNVMPENIALADTTSCTLRIYNTNTDIVPIDRGLWVLQSSYELPAEGEASLDVLVGSPMPNTYYYLILADYNQVFMIRPQHDKQGYHHLKVNIPAEFSNGNAYLVGISDCNNFQQTLILTRTAKSKLKIEAESMRDKLVPGSEESWNMRVVDEDGQAVEAALLLDMYNKALEAILPHSIGMRSGNSCLYASLNIQAPSNYNRNLSVTGIIKNIPFTPLYPPTLYTYGYPFASYSANDAMPLMATSTRSLRTANLGGRIMDKVETEAVVVEEKCREENIMYTTSSAGDDGIDPTFQADAFDYRDADVPLAIWAPSLITDAEGNLAYTFKVPNANTTWRLQALAWTKDMNVGSMIRDFVANKPIMVQPNVPRFLRAGDRALIMATVMNNSNEAVIATSTIEFFNPVTNQVIATYDFTNEIDSMSSADIQAWVDAAIDGNAIGYRVKASNGTFSDGEQGALPILPADASLVETTPFYLNPGDTSWEMRLPAGKDARLSLTFSENPAWTIVSALPGLRNSIGTTANSAAAAIYAAYISQGLMEANPGIARAIKEWLANPNDSTLISSLEKNEDLKIALLNCTPWVQAAQSDTERMANLALIFNKKECERTIDAAIKLLQKLQHTDGGWAWGEWCNESSVWVTENVLALLGDLNTSGWAPRDERLEEMAEKAFDFLESYFAKDWKEKAKRTDLLFTLIRPKFHDVPGGGIYSEKVIANTTQSILKNWKSYADPAYKAMAAEALYLNGYQKMSHELMKSISEFGVWTKDQGLKFPSVNALYDYAILLEAYAMIEPENKAIDGLRQQLIVRKQATDWGTAVVTMEVVKAILSSGSSWTVPAQGATIACGTSTIDPATPIEKYTGSLRADLTPYAGEDLMIATSGVGPAYGAVYAQFKQAMEDVKASSCDDLSIEKQIAVRRGADWIYTTDSLKVGDRVKVVLTIHCKRNLSYVTILDERAAALQPVDQVPGWLWSEGVGFYRENRDSFTGLYVDYMRPGTYQLTYELNVNTAGSFSSGVASIQSQYAPELSAHSAGSHLTIKLKD